MFIRCCPISLGFFFQTARWGEGTSGWPFGRQWVGMCHGPSHGWPWTVGGSNLSKIYPKGESKGTFPCLAGVMQPFRFFLFVFEVWWHADSPWVAFWSCKYDQWSGDTKPLSCIGDCCGYFLLAWQHGILLVSSGNPSDSKSPQPLTQVEVCWKLLWKVVQKWSNEDARHHPCHQTMTPWWCNLPKPPWFSGVDVCRFTYHAPWKVVKNRGATRKPISIPSAFATKPCHRWLRSKLLNCHGQSWKKTWVLWVCCCFRMRWSWKRLKPLKSWSLHAARNGAVRSSVWKTLDKKQLVMVVVVQHLPSVFDTVLTQYSI